MIKKLVLCAGLGCLINQSLAQQQVVTSLDTLGEYNYDLVYDELIIKRFDLGDAYINFKKFELGDFKEYYNVDDLGGKLSSFLRNYSMNNLYTMKFSFNITNNPILGIVLKHWYNNAVFKSITTIENNHVRPIFHVASFLDEEEKLSFTFYDRENFTIESYDKNMTLLSFNEYDEDVFKDILDPLSLINELVSKKPRVIDEKVYIGKFYCYNDIGGNKIFEVILDLVNDHGWKGEISLPPGVFLNSRMLVRIEYNLKGGILFPSITNKLFLKPAEGMPSYIPGWAHTQYRE